MKDCQHPDPECYCRRVGPHFRMACTVSNGRVRFSILKLAGLVGDVCERVNSEVHSDEIGFSGWSCNMEEGERNAWGSLCESVLSSLQQVAMELHVNLTQAAVGKMEINALRYPENCCCGSMSIYEAKIDQFSWRTDRIESLVELAPYKSEEGTDFGEIQRMSVEFAEARNWDAFDTPRNLCMSLLTEIGELAQLVQFNSDKEQPGLSSHCRTRIIHELSDVTIYFVRFCYKLDGRIGPMTICGVSNGSTT